MTGERMHGPSRGFEGDSIGRVRRRSEQLSVVAVTEWWVIMIVIVENSHEDLLGELVAIVAVVEKSS